MIIEDFSSSEGSGYECPACGRVFDTLKGMKTHHSRFCDAAGGDSISGTEVGCDECGRHYRMNPAEARKYDHHFCDNECKGKWQSENKTGEDASAWDGGKVTVSCANCGADIQRKRAVAESQDNHFCDRECYAETHSEQMSGENNPNYDRRPVECTACGATLMRPESQISEWNFCDGDCRREHWSVVYSGDGNPNWQGGDVATECAYCGGAIAAKPSNITERNYCDRDCYAKGQTQFALADGVEYDLESRGIVDCSWCGDSFYREPYYAQRNDHFFCSPGCYGEWCSHSRVGEDHPSWAGGWESYYGANWRRQRRRALERDRHECVVCGAGPDELGKNPDVHHIRPHREFDDPAEANRLDNLVTLCPGHHREWEGVPLRPQPAD